MSTLRHQRARILRLLAGYQAQPTFFRFLIAICAAAMIALPLPGAAIADTDINQPTPYVVTATSGFPDGGPVTVETGSTLEADGSQGSITVTNNLTLSGGGLGGILGSTPGALFAASSPNTVTVSGNVALRGDAAIGAFGSLTIAGNVGGTTSGATPGIATLTVNDLGSIAIAGSIADAARGSSYSGKLAVNIIGGGGTTTLSGNNTYTGGTTISGVNPINRATLVIASGQAVGTGDIQANDASIVLGNGGPGLTLNNSVALAAVSFGSQLLNASGNNVLNGEVSCFSACVVSAAQGTTLTLNAGLGDTPEKLDGTTLGGSQVVFNGDGAIIAAGPVTGIESVVKNGSGLLALEANGDIFASGIQLNDGTLRVSTGSALGGNANLFSQLTLAGGTLQVTSSFSWSHPTAITGQATIDTGGDALVLSGSVSGDGTLTKAGAGTLTLSGNDTFSGSSNVQGGTLLFSGAPASVFAAVTPGAALGFANAGSTNIRVGLQLSGAGDPLNGSKGALFNQSGNLALTGTIAIQGDATIYSGDPNGTLTIGGTVYKATSELQTLTIDGPGATVISGAISENPPNNDGGGGGGVVVTAGARTSDALPYGAMALVKNGSGVLALQGANGYLGGTVLNAGTLVVSNDANLGDPSGDLTLNGGTLELAGNVSSARPVLLGGAATVQVDSGTNSGFSGTVSGSGSLAVAGAPDGSVALSGTNTYTGGTVLNSGTLVVTSDPNLGDPSGGLTLNGGTLYLPGRATIARSVTLGGPATIETGYGVSSDTISGTISGPGSLIVSSSGIYGNPGVRPGPLILSGSNSYAGGTFIEIGTLAITSDANLGAPGGGVTINGGSLEFMGNIVSSRPIVLGGPLPAGAAPVTNFNAGGGGDITLDAGTVSTLAGPVSGAYQFTIIGPGTLTLSGANSYTGGTYVSLARLVVANPGALATGPVSLNYGATLETDGINHTILVNGDFSMSQSTLVFHAGGNERLIVTGSAALGGDVLITGPMPSHAGVLAEVSAASVTGRFDAVTTDSGAGLPVIYGPQTVLFGQEPFLPLATTPNQAAVAAALDRAVGSSPAGDFGAVIAALDGLPTNAAIAAGLDQLSPQRFQLFRQIAFDQSGFMASTLGTWLDADRAGAPALDVSGLDVENRSEGPLGMQVRRTMAGLVPAALALDDAPTSAPRSTAGGLSGFVSGTVTTADVEASGGIAKTDFTTGGVVAGVAWHPDDDWALGVLFAYGHTDATLDGEGSKGRVESYAPGLFAAYAAGGLHGQAVLAWQAEDYTTSRRVLIGALDRTAHGDPSGDAPMAAIGLGYDWQDEGVRFGPTLDAIYTRLSIDPFAETGAGSAGLAVGGLGSSSFRTRLGAHAAFTTEIAGIVLHPDIDLAWQREFAAGSDPIAAGFEGLTTAGFQVASASLRGNSLFGGFNVSGSISDTAALFLGYQIQAGNGETAHNVVAGLKIAF